MSTRSYQEQIKLGMHQKEVLAILGPPDKMSEGEVFDEWEWERLSGEADDVWVSISFHDGAVSGVEMIKGGPESDLAKTPLEIIL